MNRLHPRWLAPAVFLLVASGSLPAISAAAESRVSAASLPNPFFAYCVGIGVGKETASLQAQLELPKMLSDLGYAGMAYVGLDGSLEMLDALEKQGLKLFAVYTPLNVDPDKPGYDPRLKEIIPKLQGHGTVVWLVLNSTKYKPSSTEGDDRAVELLREIADQARPYGISLSMYPHRGSYTERLEDVVRVIKKTGRPNVGATFTLCHFLAVDDARNLDRVLQLAKPYLNMVNINGTDGYDPKNRAGWIQTLDQGSFDLVTVLKALRKVDYRGPIGLIAFGIKGDRRDILARSIKAWKELSAKAASDSGSR